MVSLIFNISFYDPDGIWMVFLMVFWVVFVISPVDLRGRYFISSVGLGTVQSECEVLSECPVGDILENSFQEGYGTFSSYSLCVLYSGFL